MSTADDERLQINLTPEEAEELAFQSLQDDPDNLVLLLEGIKERNPIDAEGLIIFAVNKIFCLTTGYNDRKDDFIQAALKKLREK